MACSNCGGGGLGPQPVGRFCSTACKDAAEGRTSSAAQPPQPAILSLPDYSDSGAQPGVEAFVGDGAFYGTGPDRYPTPELPQALPTAEPPAGEDSGGRPSGVWDEQERRALTDMRRRTESAAATWRQDPDPTTRPPHAPQPATPLPDTVANAAPPDAAPPDPAPPTPSDGTGNLIRDVADLILDALFSKLTSRPDSSAAEHPPAALDTSIGERAGRPAEPGHHLQPDREYKRGDFDRSATEPPRRTLCVNCVGHEARQGVYCSGCAAQAGDSESLPHLRSPLVEVVAPDDGGISILESRGARDDDQIGAVSVRAIKEKGVITGPMADLGEERAYKHALANGEIGLEAPFKVNDGGADFITAVFDPDHGYKIVLTDTKWSEKQVHPTPETLTPPTWLAQAYEAVHRVDLGDEGLNKLIKDAWDRGEVYLRQIDVDASPAGQMAVHEHPLVRLT